jgi:hypothetical protein
MNLFLVVMGARAEPLRRAGETEQKWEKSCRRNPIRLVEIPEPGLLRLKTPCNSLLKINHPKYLLPFFRALFGAQMFVLLARTLALVGTLYTTDVDIIFALRVICGTRNRMLQRGLVGKMQYTNARQTTNLLFFRQTRTYQRHRLGPI